MIRRDRLSALCCNALWYMIGNTSNVNIVAVTRPPMITTASGF